MDENKEVEVLENETPTYVDIDTVEVDVENEATDVYVGQQEIDIDIADENIIEIEIEEAFPFTARGILDTTFKDKDVLIDGGVVDSVNNEVISMQEVLENCAALGGAENVSHGTLYGTEQPNCHPISAIEGLEDELKEIKALKTIYSDKSGLADYYLWQDNNTAKEDRFGYFVFKCSDNTIKIIEDKDEDVFGVVTDTSAFIGGQNDVARNHRYGLVVYIGEALVRCESDVDIGDFVTTNSFGEAKKSEGGYGYKVSAVENIHNIKYATISLNISANQMDNLGADVEDLDDRMDSAEKNITSAINVANKAYNLALAGGSEDIGSLNASTVEKAEEALDKANTALDMAESFNSQIQGAITTATQAKTIANNAVTSAESIKTEAVATANQALSEATSTRTELQGQIDQTKKDLNDTKTELIKSISNIDGTVADFKIEVEDTYATQEMLTAYKTESSTALTDYKQEVKDNYATQEMVSLVETNTTNALTDYKQEVTNTYATQEMVSQYKDEASDALTLYKQEVSENYATQEMFTSLETNTSKALTDYKQEVTDTYAKQETLTSFQGSVNSSLNTLTQKSDANGAYIQGFVANIDKYSYGKYSQANRFTYEEALNILELGVVYVPSTNHSETYEKSDNYDAVTYNFQRGYYYTWSKSTDAQGKEIMTWVGSETSSVAFSSEYAIGNHNMPYWVAEADLVYNGVNYEKDCLYKLINGIWVKVATSQGNLGSVTTSLLKQTSNSIEMAIADVTGGDYAGIKAQVDENSAAIQDVVTWSTDANGEQYKLATIQSKAEEAESSVALVVAEKDGDKVVNSASIVTAINDGDSSVTIDADHINFNGFATFMSENVLNEALGANGVTTIDGGRITTGAISSKDYVDTNKGVYSTTGTCFNLDDGSITAPNFAVTSDGFLYADYADISGYVIATGGSFKNCTIENTCTVGGWEITNSGICHNGLVGMISRDLDLDNYSHYALASLVNPSEFAPIRFYAGAPSDLQAYDSKFAVLEDGSLYATFAHIEGDITATSGSFTGTVNAKKGDIAGWTIDQHFLMSNPYMIDGVLNESVYISGLSAATGGETVNGYAVSYNHPSLVTDGDWSPVRFFAGWTPYNEDGIVLTGYNAPFMVLEDGSLYANAAKFGNWIINDNGMFECDIGEIDWNPVEKSAIVLGAEVAGVKMVHNISAQGLVLQRTSSGSSLNCTLWGNQMLFYNNTTTLEGHLELDPNDGFFITGEKITIGQSDGSITMRGFVYNAPTVSDRNAKNSIQETPDVYEVLFDNLRSKIFKYNDGTSDRYHTGFEAQGVDEAIQKAGLTRKDFAAVCIANEGTEKEHWGLRYDEFVSLNTWQIQKLKARVTALEERVAQLEKK